MVVILLSIPAVQRSLLSKGEGWLKEKTKTELSIGHVGFDLFNGIFIEDLYVEDLKGDTLLFAGKLKANVNPHAFLHLDNLKIRKVELDDFVAHVDKSSDSAFFNFQFIIDAFASGEEDPEKDTTSSFGLTIRSIVLQNGWVTYDVLSAPETPDTFNASHLSLSNLRMEASFKLSPKGVISAELEDFAVDEHCGLRVTGLSAEVSLEDDKLSLPELSLSLPKSRLDLRAECSLDSLAYNLSLRSDSFSLADVRCFVPMFADMRDSLSVSVDAAGTFPAIVAHDLSIDYPAVLRLEAPLVRMDDCMVWDSSAYDLKLQQLVVTKNGFSRLSDMLGLEGLSSVTDYFPLETSIEFKGSLPQGSLSCGFSSPMGKISADGGIAYKNSAEYMGCDLSFLFDHVALDSILKSSDFEHLSMTADLNVDWNMKAKPNASLKANLPGFSYKNYRYDTLSLAARYFSSDSLSSSVEIHDPHLDGTVSVDMAALSDASPRMSFAAAVRDFSPKATHLSDSLGNAMIDISLSGGVTNLNEMIGKVLIDSLYFRNDSARIKWSKPCVASHEALGDGARRLTFSSPVLDAEMEGVYDFAELYPAALEVARAYWPDLLPDMPKTDSVLSDRFSFRVDVKDVADFLRFAGVDLVLRNGASLKGSLSVADSAMSLNVSVPSFSMGGNSLRDVSLRLVADGERMKVDADLVADSAAGNTELLDVALRSSIAGNRMDGGLSLATTPDTSLMKGTLPFSVFSDRNASGGVDMNLSTKQSDWILMGNRFGFAPAEVRQRGEKIVVDNMGISLGDERLMDVRGVVSDELSDTLNIRFDHVQVAPILSAFLRKRLPIRCVLDGDLMANALTGEKMRFRTSDLRLDSIFYEDIRIGDLTADMRWNNERKGILSRITLTNDGRKLAYIHGVVKPAEDMVKMVVTLDSIRLETLVPFVSDYVSDFKGYLGADILAEGQLSNADLSGYLYLKDSHARINYTGVGYSISDSIKFNKKQLSLDHFTMRDDNGQKLTLDGKITHERFESFKYDLAINMHKFLLLNNPKDKSNTVYGVFYANAKDLTLKGSDTRLNVRGEFSNGDKTSLNIVLPETVTEVQSYDNIVYVTPESEKVKDTVADKPAEIPFDVDADISVGLTDQASFYVNVADGAMINGSGNLRVIYKEGVASLYNRYTVKSGYVKIKLSEIPAKKFSIQEGAYVDFNGDPMKLKFDATASYDLTADLATLSNTFSNMGLGSTRQPVRCNAHASGSLSEMNLTYDITLPKADDNVRQNFNSIVSTDDIRIREFAYLIGLGMFYAPSEQAQGDVLTSLASSSLSAALNNALSSVLGDKVSIGTDFGSSQEDFSDVEMNVSVSTKLFNDRLLLSTNLGYQKQGAEADNGSSFLGDFDAEYLLGKKKVVRVKAYNHTNNDFYHTSNNTQGVGVVFVKEAKTFRGILPFARDEKGNNLLAPRDTTAKKGKEVDDEKE